MKQFKTAADVRAMMGCTLGVGLFLAWTVGDAYTKAVAQIPAVSVAHALDIAFGVGLNVITLAVVAICAKSVVSIAERRNLRIIACVLAVGGPLLMTFSYRYGSSLPLMCVGSALRGVAAALLFLMWNELFARFPIREVSICYAGAYLVSVVAQLAVSALPAEFALVVTLACPLVSTGLLACTVEHLPREKAVSQPARGWVFPWRPLLLAMVYTFVAFAFFQLFGGNAGSVSRLGTAAVSAVCLVGCLFFFQKSFDAMALGLAAFPLMVAAILLWCWQGDNATAIVAFLADASNVAFRIFILAMLCNICYRYNVPALWLFAIVRMSMMAAEGCGLGLSLAITWLGVDTTAWVVPACYAIVVLLTVICTFTFRAQKPSGISWGIVAKDEERSSRLKDVMGAKELMLWKCSQTARLYGLTHREEEVLSCLVDGMTRTQIEETLVLSESTVRTHLRHLYGKLGVHNKEDAIAIVTKAG